MGQIALEISLKWDKLPLKILGLTLHFVRFIVMIQKTIQGILLTLPVQIFCVVIMAKKAITVAGEIIKKSNELVRARTNVRDVESARVLAHLIACINVNDTTFEQAYTVQAKDMLPYMTGGNDFRRIKSICRGLLGSFAELEGKDEDGEPIYEARTYFTSIKYSKGLITALFNPLMRDHLLNLKGCFTAMNLKEYLSLPSIYSQRLFEILRSWQNHPAGEIVLSLRELHKQMDVPTSLRGNFKDFRVRVLDKAHLDITRKTSLIFNWEAIKVGRSVERIRFTFGTGKKKRSLSQGELEQAKAEKAQRLANKRFIAAVFCAEKKGGHCQEQDNKRIVCKVCKQQGFCATV